MLKVFFFFLNFIISVVVLEERQTEISSTAALKGAYTQRSVTSMEAYVSLTLYLSLLITNNNIAPLGAQG